MKKNSFTTNIRIHNGANEAIQKITNIPGWWGISFEGNADKENAKFSIKMGGDSFFHLNVEKLLPGKKIVWTVLDCNMPWYSDKHEWTNTKLIFELAEKDGLTDIIFTHEGLTPEIECYKDCASGWTHWIQTSLFSYLTNGTGVFRPATK